MAFLQTFVDKFENNLKILGLGYRHFRRNYPERELLIPSFSRECKLF